MPSTIFVLNLKHCEAPPATRSHRVDKLIPAKLVAGAKEVAALEIPCRIEHEFVKCEILQRQWKAYGQDDNGKSYQSVGETGGHECPPYGLAYRCFSFCQVS